LEILRPDGEYRDIPPVRDQYLGLPQGDRQESGSKGHGGREGYARLSRPRAGAEKLPHGAIAKALVQSWNRCRRRRKWMWCWRRCPGVMLHEAPSVTG